MKNHIRSVGIRTVAAVRIVMIAAVMAFAVTGSTGTPVASAPVSDPPRFEFRFGPFKICLMSCYVPGYCCEADLPLS